MEERGEIEERREGRGKGEERREKEERRRRNSNNLPGYNGLSKDATFSALACVRL